MERNFLFGIYKEVSRKAIQFSQADHEIIFICGDDFGCIDIALVKRVNSVKLFCLFVVGKKLVINDIIIISMPNDLKKFKDFRYFNISHIGIITIKITEIYHSNRFFVHIDSVLVNIRSIFVFGCFDCDRISLLSPFISIFEAKESEFF